MNMAVVLSLIILPSSLKLASTTDHHPTNPTTSPASSAVPTSMAGNRVMIPLSNIYATLKIADGQSIRLSLSNSFTDSS